MAKESGRKKSPNQLKAEIARSRDLVERDLRDLRSELDFPRKIRRSFRRNTALWIGAAAVLGVVLVMRTGRKKKVYVAAKTAVPTTKLVEAGFALGALRVAATLLKPMVVSFISRKMRDYAGGRHF